MKNKKASTVIFIIGTYLFLLTVGYYFFLISNKDIYSRTLPYAEKHKVERKIQMERKSVKIKKGKDTKYTGES